eukprot:TRINITY_DN3211_c0_g1_i1.p1 TRINITY_DN3211_c0_g1~~TRINITY_DN3211_c0_g1_i1.p1  ORF type:complete len:303 (+),score=39.16 TRINITY_DN3211_c0_g1_i1:57-965(+)
MASKESDAQSAALHLLAGAAAGMVSDCIVHPIDTVRARLQTQKGQMYKGMFDAFKQTVSREGWLALYKGIGIVWAFTTPAHALYFAGYELSKKIIMPHKKAEEKGFVVHFMSGVVADIAGGFVWTPMDVVKQRLQVQRNNEGIKYRNSFHGVTTIFREEGIRGLYRGFGAAIATYAPFVGFYFAFYEQWKRSMGQLRGVDSESLTLIEQLSGAFLAGALASAVTNPLDVVKTNMQVYSVSEGGQATIAATIRHIVKTEGMSAFMKGMNARILWIAPGTAITMAAYEQWKNAFAKLGRKAGLL